jgi:hypothetical protein
MSRIGKLCRLQRVFRLRGDTGQAMGRAYAGILGSLAFALSIARGVGAGSSLEGSVLAASGALFVFAALGYIAGQTADYLVSDSFRAQFQVAMTTWNEKQQKQAKAQPKPAT